MTHDDAEKTDERTVGDSAPWHFWIVVVALIAYIGWRIVDFVMGFF